MIYSILIIFVLLWTLFGGILFYNCADDADENGKLLEITIISGPFAWLLVSIVMGSRKLKFVAIMMDNIFKGIKRYYKTPKSKK